MLSTAAVTTIAEIQDLSHHWIEMSNLEKQIFMEDVESWNVRKWGILLNVHEWGFTFSASHLFMLTALRFMDGASHIEYMAYSFSCYSLIILVKMHHCR